MEKENSYKDTLPDWHYAGISFKMFSHGKLLGHTLSPMNPS